MWKQSYKRFHTTGVLALFCTLGLTTVGVVQAEGTSTDNATNMNMGYSNNSTIGSNNVSCQDTGTCVGGDASGSNINNNQNNLTTGSNTNVNALSPVMVAPSSASGGNSALVLPRNPLHMPNAALGRSNFGMQFGVNNNPMISAMNGGENALGWFMQAGVNIPFGKIPEAFRNPNSGKMDDLRRNNMAQERNVFGGVQQRPNTDVQGRVVGLSAYNYSTVSSSKVNTPESVASRMPNLGEVQLSQPKVLALEPSQVFNRPLHTGEKIGLVEVGREYPYLGHTRSGWVKILLPDGTEGWASTHFEYIKFDFTEVDGLAIDDTPNDKKTARNNEEPTGNLKSSQGG